MQWIKDNKLFVAVTVIGVIVLASAAWWVQNHRNLNFPPPTPVSDEQRQLERNQE